MEIDAENSSSRPRKSRLERELSRLSSVELNGRRFDDEHRRRWGAIVAVAPAGKIPRKTAVVGRRRRSDDDADDAEYDAAALIRRAARLVDDILTTPPPARMDLDDRRAIMMLQEQLGALAGYVRAPPAVVLPPPGADCVFATPWQCMIARLANDVGAIPHALHTAPLIDRPRLTAAVAALGLERMAAVRRHVECAVPVWSDSPAVRNVARTQQWLPRDALQCIVDRLDDATARAFAACSRQCHALVARRWNTVTIRPGTVPRLSDVALPAVRAVVIDNMYDRGKHGITSHLLSTWAAAIGGNGGDLSLELVTDKPLLDGRVERHVVDDAQRLRPTHLVVRHRVKQANNRDLLRHMDGAVDVSRVRTLELHGPFSASNVASIAERFGALRHIVVDARALPALHGLVARQLRSVPPVVANWRTARVRIVDPDARLESPLPRDVMSALAAVDSIHCAGADDAAVMLDALGAANLLAGHVCYPTVDDPHAERRYRLVDRITYGPDARPVMEHFEAEHALETAQMEYTVLGAEDDPDVTQLWLTRFFPTLVGVH